MNKHQAKRKWVAELNPGDKVRTNYPDVFQGYREVTIEAIVTNPASGLKVKLKEIPSEIDLFWITKGCPSKPKRAGVSGGTR